MRDATVDDVSSIGAVEGAERRTDLGDHAAGDDSLGDQRRCPAAIEFAEQRALAVVDTVDIGQDDQLGGTQRDRKLGGDGVGVDVVRLAVVSSLSYLHTYCYDSLSLRYKLCS